MYYSHLSSAVLTQMTIPNIIIDRDRKKCGKHQVRAEPAKKTKIKIKVEMP